ncbi:sodium channel protein Nach-like [Topomyia yanbarensis]|uniref:sodium channel protein Nach-like n=1 Tax=Topomyia yanbarensis TaxID=2498891 RepID=UPI00273C774A|nr:sodium channel protein Nach-like [Topomyia yanbarensis]
MAYKFHISKFIRRVLERSTFHGVYHVANKKNSLCEKISWGLAILLAVIGMSYLLVLFWIRYLTNPTVISLDRNYHEWNTTFPSLTVCFHDRLNVTARDILVEELKPEDPQRFERFLALLAEANIFRLEPLVEFDEYSDLDLQAVLNQITNHVNTTVILDNGLDAKTYRVVTELGICYTFNSAMVRFTTVDALDEEDLPKGLIQVSTMERDIMASLSNLTSNGDIFYHGPYEVPSYLKRLIVTLSTSAFLTITFKPVIITADATIQNLYVQQRRCRFPDESNLALFPNYYSHSLCLLDCRLRLFLKYCGCVPYFYNLEVKVPVCRLKQLRCVVDNLAEIRQTLSSCGCLKDCNTISFTLQNYVMFDWFNDPLIKWNMETPKVRYSRKIIYGFADFMVSIGGIHGLFFGASVISFIELLYSFIKNVLQSLIRFRSKMQDKTRVGSVKRSTELQNDKINVKFNERVTYWY